MNEEEGEGTAVVWREVEEGNGRSICLKDVFLEPKLGGVPSPSDNALRLSTTPEEYLNIWKMIHLELRQNDMLSMLQNRRYNKKLN